VIILGSNQPILILTSHFIDLYTVLFAAFITHQHHLRPQWSEPDAGNWPYYIRFRLGFRTVVPKHLVRRRNSFWELVIKHPYLHEGQHPCRILGPSFGLMFIRLLVIFHVRKIFLHYHHFTRFHALFWFAQDVFGTLMILVQFGGEYSLAQFDRIVVIECMIRCSLLLSDVFIPFHLRYQCSAPWSLRQLFTSSHLYLFATHCDSRIFYSKSLWACFSAW